MSTFGSVFGRVFGSVFGSVGATTPVDPIPPVSSGVVRPEPRVRFRKANWDKIVADVEGPKAHAARNVDIAYEFGSGKNKRIFIEKKPPYD